MKKEKGIDDIFKHSLQDAVNEPAFEQSDWDSFENMLGQEKRSGKVVWLPILGSVAAVLLAFFGWWLFMPQNVPVMQNKQQVAVNKTPKTKTTATDASQPQIAVNNRPGVRTTTLSNIKSAGMPRNLASVGNANSAALTVNKKKRLGITAFSNNIKSDAARPDIIIAAASKQSLTIGPVWGPEDEALSAQPKTGINAMAIGASKTVKPVINKAVRPQYALSVLAASEVNGVGSFQSTSPGTNVGLLFTVGLKKFSISTGANYSTKPYSLPFSAYHTNYKFKYEPESVSADCRVLDIPINIGYQLLNKSGNKIGIGTGISSYIMMHESYNYNYGDSPYKGPASYAVKGKGKYYFSIMNLQASYERKVNAKVGLSLTPYLKLPLSDIGYSQVRVQTFGVAVGLNWDINSIRKPK